jgi:hypothetical protein
MIQMEMWVSTGHTCSAHSRQKKKKEKGDSPIEGLVKLPESDKF